MKFRSGDIIEGTEGLGKSYENTAVLLVLAHDGLSGDALCVVLETRSPRRGTEREDIHATSASAWVLEDRDWKKIGYAPELAGFDTMISMVSQQWRKCRDASQ